MSRTAAASITAPGAAAGGFVYERRRGMYLRWSFFALSVIEPGAMAKISDWKFKESQAGWGGYETMLGAMERAVEKGPFLLGGTFSMADVVFGGAVRYMLMFKMIEPRPAFVAYVERLATRPALQRATARNEAIRKEHGLGG